MSSELFSVSSLYLLTLKSFDIFLYSQLSEIYKSNVFAFVVALGLIGGWEAGTVSH